MQNIATLITFLFYLVMMLGIGVYAYKQTNDLSDYILGGRKLGRWVTALSAGASDMSGWLLMGLPGAIYAGGFSEAWIGLGLMLGAYWNWKITAPRLRIYTEHAGNALTLPDYFSNRFLDETKILRVVSASIILIFFTVYVASGLTAGAKLFEASFQMDYHLALFVGGAVIISYTFIGGFLAVSWTDLVQGLLMATALVVVPLVMIFEIGSFGEVLNVTHAIDQASSSVKSDIFAGKSATDYLFSVSFISLMAWGLGYYGQPHLLARFMAADSVKAVHGARRIAMSWMGISMCGSICVGLFAIAYFYQTENGALLAEDAEQVFIIASKVIFNPWIAGFLLAAILAAVMSTIDSQLLVSSSAVTEDFYRGLIKPSASDKELVTVGRIAVLVVAAVALMIATDKDSKVLDLVSNAWAGFGAAFGPVVLISLVWRNMTRWGALAGMIGGALTVILWINIKVSLPEPWAQLYEMIPGVIVASLFIYLVSRFGPKNDTRVGDSFDHVNLTYRGHL
ncbi:sodium/proline symporter PutP [Aliikangiella sp. G2MR2-5]|uniref:sodium/proline symporter PutP n=1 Tax=Aliikangiella sp. G2MR2-5 TaxID=2788943 RepID=UPI0018AA82AE|nr:sodium/proline symporter PutP [Aliikangiella sp. G2MR2-5]